MMQFVSKLSHLLVCLLIQNRRKFLLLYPLLLGLFWFHTKQKTVPEGQRCVGGDEKTHLFIGHKCRKEKSAKQRFDSYYPYI